MQARELALRILAGASIAAALGACGAPAKASAGEEATTALGSSGGERPAAPVERAQAAPSEDAGEPPSPGSTDEAPAEDEVLADARAMLAEARAALPASDYATARRISSEAIELLLSADAREDSAERISLLSELGRCARDAGDPKAAERAWRGELEVWTRTLPDDDPHLQAARGNLALAIKELGDLKGARALEEKVLEVRTRALPDDHPDLQAARLNLAVTIEAQGDLPGARALEEKALEVFSRTLPDDHPDLQMARQNLAVTIKTLGDLEGARALEERVLEISSRTLPEDHPDLAAARLNLAATIQAQGDLPGARSLEEKVLEVFSRTLPDDHPDLQKARGNLAGTLSALGDLSGARALQEMVLEIRTRTLPEDHPDLAAARLRLASTLAALGDLPGARTLEEQALEVLARTLPEDHPDLQLARLNLAATIKALGDHSGARALEEKVLEVFSRTLPDDHPDLQASRNNLAVTMQALGDLPGARALQEKVLEVLSRALLDDHPDLQVARLNLAATIEAQEDLPAARALEEKALEVLSRTLPDDHPRLQAARANLAGTIALELSRASGGEGEARQESERCSILVHDFAASCARTAREATLSSSSREAEERCSSLGRHLSISLSFAAGYGVFDPDPGLARDAFVLSESTRGGALAAARLAQLARGDERCDGLRREIRAAGDELARLARAGSARDAYDASIARRDRAQRELVQLASRSKDAAGFLMEPDPAALSERLSEKDAIAAFRRYTRIEIPAGAAKEKSTESLCAFLVRRGAELRIVDLGPIEPIEAAVRDWRELLGAQPERGMSVSKLEDRRQRVQEKGKSLRRLVFDPLSPELDGTERLIVALDDVLHCVPLDALPLEADTLPTSPADVASSATDGVPARPANAAASSASTALLGDRYRIEQRHSLAGIGGAPAATTGASGAATLVTLGGASFNSEPLAPSAEETAALDVGKMEPAAVASLLRGGAWERGFEPLTYTGLEARAVAELFEEAQNAGTSDGTHALVLEKRKASRAAVEELAPKARFLHVATHGWFAPESVRSWSDPESGEEPAGAIARVSAEERVKGSSPMLLCGLALAGANLPADAVGRCPGLVTAEEISGWDLSSCELAVLSACDTNVGERRAGQGVASLQKALHMAGARTVITSLWKVPDEATKELMLDFYRRIWIEKKPKAQALWEAKKRLRDAADERGRPKYSTRDWAAWVLTGDPR